MKVLIKGVAPAATPIPELLNRWSLDRVKIWGLNDQRTQPWHQHWQTDWQITHTLEWFQLHGLGHMVEAHGKDYLIWLSGLDCPLYMFQKQILRWALFVNQELKLDVPLPEFSTHMPVEQIIQLAGQKYCTNSFGWMVALAILQGATDIMLTGITLGEDTKQLWLSRREAAKLLQVDSPWSCSDAGREKIIKDLIGEGVGEESWIIPNLEFWIGIARGRGINVTIDRDQHGLFYDKWNGLYGLEAGGEY